MLDNFLPTEYDSSLAYWENSCQAEPRAFGPGADPPRRGLATVPDSMSRWQAAQAVRLFRWARSGRLTPTCEDVLGVTWMSIPVTTVPAVGVTRFADW